MRKIRITAAGSGVEMTAGLNDTETAGGIWEALPIEASAQVWGDEIYFSISVAMAEDDARAQVPSGTIAYWPPGNAFCIFFGQTPYSPVNIVGAVEGDENEFGKVKPGETIRLERVE